MELWEQLEKHACLAIQGTLTPASGRLRVKGDVRSDLLYVECKHRSNKSGRVQSISKEWLRTCEINTKKLSLIPVIAYQEDLDGTPGPVLWFCRRLDAEVFETVSLTVSLDSSWCQISEESVRNYARSEAESISYA